MNFRNLTTIGSIIILALALSPTDPCADSNKEKLIQLPFLTLEDRGTGSAESKGSALKTSWGNIDAWIVPVGRYTARIARDGTVLETYDGIVDGVSDDNQYAILGLFGEYEKSRDNIAKWILIDKDGKEIWSVPGNRSICRAYLSSDAGMVVLSKECVEAGPNPGSDVYDIYGSLLISSRAQTITDPILLSDSGTYICRSRQKSKTNSLSESISCVDTRGNILWSQEVCESPKYIFAHMPMANGEWIVILRRRPVPYEPDDTIELVRLAIENNGARILKSNQIDLSGTQSQIVSLEGIHAGDENNSMALVDVITSPAGVGESVCTLRMIDGKSLTPRWEKRLVLSPHAVALYGVHMDPRRSTINISYLNNHSAPSYRSPDESMVITHIEVNALGEYISSINSPGYMMNSNGSFCYGVGGSDSFFTCGTRRTDFFRKGVAE